MRKIITNIFMLLLVSTAVLSCSVGMMNDAAMAPGDIEVSIMVTGTASDIETGKPIEEIRITLHASETIVNGMTLLTDKTTYTDNSGKFAITMGGFRNPTSFTVTTEDPNGIYESAKHEIPLVTWDFDYNISDGTFFVNGCDFHLKKIK